jgi:hypothetical protein
VNRRVLIAGGVGAVALAGVGGAVMWSRPRPVAWRGEGDCGPPVTRADLDAAVGLGADYLRASLLPAGHFVYEVDWKTGNRPQEDNVVRQAGALWGLALAHHDGVTAAAGPLDQALAFWTERQRRAGDLAWVVDFGLFSRRGGAPSRGQTGALALIGLALVDRLRSSSAAALAPALRDQYVSLLDGIIAWIRAARLPGGGFATQYDPETGVSGGAPNPYADGEALLLLARAGIYLDRPSLVSEAEQIAVEDHRRNVEVPLAAEPDPDTTKGYYQWASMSWRELATAGHAAERHDEWLRSLAVWMVDVHRTLQRRKNTAYAYEGILSAYDRARQRGDEETSYKLACVAHQGLRKLFSWQIGHPLAMETLAAAPEQYRGGVQNAADEPALRIDVTQHQTHAAILARRYGIDQAEV